MRTGRKTPCGQSRCASRTDIAERTPNRLASYEAVLTTPREPGSPPTMTGLPASSGWSPTSTEAKKASMSTWMTRVTRLPPRAGSGGQIVNEFLGQVTQIHQPANLVRPMLVRVRPADAEKVKEVVAGDALDKSQVVRLSGGVTLKIRILVSQDLFFGLPEAVGMRVVKVDAQGREAGQDLGHNLQSPAAGATALDAGEDLLDNLLLVL